MSDLIRRGDVEEALQGLHVGDVRFFEKLRKALDEIPSAEPERRLWCNLCASYDKKSCYCNLYGIFTASDFGCRDFGAYCEEDGDD